MNKRNKIIVSVVGVLIIILALLGITYGYFLTRIVGNTNETSISITTANLRLVYRDGTPEVLTQTNIQPSNTVFTKTFTVTNEGNASIDYEVYLENVLNDFEHEEDLLMFITCTSNIEGNTCNGYGDGSVNENIPTFGTSLYPQVNSKLISNSIEPASEGVVAEVHTYTLYLMFEDDGSDQSDDMGKELKGKIQIYDPKDVVAISGKVTDAEGNVPEDIGDYYVELTELDDENNIIETKLSNITSNGNYIFYGVGTENHTLYLKKKNTDGTISEIDNSTIAVTKGDTASITSNASSIVINDDSYKATVNIKLGENNTSVTIEGKEVSETPFDTETLAYEIYKNKAIVEEYSTDENNNFISQGTQLNNDLNELTTITRASNGINIKDSGLFYTKDDYGTSYFFRGTVRNNYLDFAGFTWRIVRINGDGSVRLILDGTLDKVKQRLSDGISYADSYAGDTNAFNWSYDDNAYIGYTYGQIGVTADVGTKTAYDLTHEYTGDKTNKSDKTGQSQIKQEVDRFYENYLLNNYGEYISDTLFCGDKSLASILIGSSNTALGFGTNKTYYAATQRLMYSSGTMAITEATPTLKCVANNTSLTEEQKAYSRYTVNGNRINGIKTNDDLIYPIALLSADELVFAGAWGGAYENYYKDKKNEQYYLYNANTLFDYWWTMTPFFAHDFSVMFRTTLSGGTVHDTNIHSINGVRPVINLSYENVLYDSGDGTSEDPYKVKLRTN